MISIYLVDDEPMAVRYMEMLLEGCGYPCEIAGTSTNPSRAWSEIRSLKPDIVFTDISMPVMNGLELAEKILKTGETLVYLLTSYEDFEYAKKGVRIGASDYLLKNEMSEKMLHAILEKAEQEITAARRQRQLILEANIRDFLLGSSAVPEDHIYEERQMQRYALLHFSKPARLRMDSDRIPEEPLKLDCYALQHMNYPAGLKCTAFTQTGTREYCAVIFISETVVDSARRVFQAADAILAGIAEYDPGWKCVCSDICRHFFDLQEQYRKAAGCTAYLYTQRDQSVCFAAELPVPEPGDAAIDDKMEQIRQLLAAKDHEGTVRKTQELFVLCREHDTQQAYMEHMRGLLQILKHISIRSRFGTAYLSVPAAYSNTTDLERALLNCVELYFEQREHEAKAQYSEHVLRAQQFIRREYVRDISVSDIADSAGISEGHLRRLFKQEMNMSVVDYLTEYRIGQAKRMLQERICPSSEVWKATGFSSAQYFSYVFKKKEGISPREYQKQEI